MVLLLVSSALLFIGINNVSCVGGNEGEYQWNEKKPEEKMKENVKKNGWSLHRVRLTLSDIDDVNAIYKRTQMFLRMTRQP
jgi:hypothetical protein